MPARLRATRPRTRAPPPVVDAQRCRRERRFPFSLGRAWSYSLRETLELQRDPMRATMALLGTAILMFVFGYGISLDVEDLTYAVLDRDQTGLSRNYALNLAGSRYFIEHAPITDDADLDQRMRAGELALAIEIPPGFARDMARGHQVQIGAWVDGAMPVRAETVRGYVQGMHQIWLQDLAKHRLGRTQQPARQRSKPATATTPTSGACRRWCRRSSRCCCMMIPAMLTALSVVREKELGSIINLYVTPVTRSEFLLGKQLPYIVLAMLNFALMTAARRHRLRRADQGQLAGTDGGGAALRHLLHRLWPARLDLHPQPDRRHVRDHDRHHHPLRAVRRPAQPGVLARRCGRISSARSTRPPTS